MALLSKATQSLIFLISTAFLEIVRWLDVLESTTRLTIKMTCNSRVKNSNQLVMSLDSMFSSFYSSSYFKPNIAFLTNIKFDFRQSKNCWLLTFPMFLPIEYHTTKKDWRNSYVSKSTRKHGTCTMEHIETLVNIYEG